MGNPVRDRVEKLAWELLDKKLNLDSNGKYTLTELVDVIRLCEHQQLNDVQMKKFVDYVERAKK